MPLDTNLESFVRELKIVLYEINDVLTHAESMNEGISFSRFILAANACRRALPKTSMYSNRLSQDHSSNMVLVEMQKYIIHHKISLEEAFLYFDVDCCAQQKRIAEIFAKTLSRVKNNRLKHKFFSAQCYKTFDNKLLI